MLFEGDVYYVCVATQKLHFTCPIVCKQATASPRNGTSNQFPIWIKVKFVGSTSNNLNFSLIAGFLMYSHIYLEYTS